MKQFLAFILTFAALSFADTNRTTVGVLQKIQANTPGLNTTSETYYSYISATGVGLYTTDTLSLGENTLKSPIKLWEFGTRVDTVSVWVTGIRRDADDVTVNVHIEYYPLATDLVAGPYILTGGAATALTEGAAYTCQNVKAAIPPGSRWRVRLVIPTASSTDSAAIYGVVVRGLKSIP